MIKSVGNQKSPCSWLLASGSFWIGLFIFVLLTRGLLQLLMPTSVAMMTHLVLLALFTFTFTWKGGATLSPGLLPLLFWLGAFLFCLFVSVALTSYQGLTLWPTYGFFTVYSVISAAIFARLGVLKAEEIPFAKILLWAGSLLFAVALIEQFHLISMPGASKFVIVRPASTTGSMLHYPIILALIAYCLIQWYALTGRRVYLWAGLLFCLAQVAALSRSGMLIVAGGYGFVVLLTILKRPQTILKGGAILVGVALLLGLALAADPQSLPHKVALRIVSAADFHAPGNADRVRKWMISLSRWSETNWLFGEMTGIATNSSLVFSLGPAFITESGLLQQLLNYGLMGVITYYAFFISLGLLIRTEHIYLRAAFFASLFETLVYQSVEVVSFMTLLCLFPWISQVYALKPRKARAFDPGCLTVRPI